MKQTMFAFRAETSLHAGTGQNAGVVDLPVQREAHTGWPCVFGSSVKGAVRAQAEIEVGWKVEEVERVFGREDASEASGIAFTDARLLLLPVRSLTGHFRWATCPAMLRRLQRDMALIGRDADFDTAGPDSGAVLAAGEGELFLEEFRFTIAGAPDAALTGFLEELGAEGAAGRLAVMHDDDFAWFARNATAIAPHIAIDNATKTVRTGALWYEESLPSDALLYALAMGDDGAVDAVSAMWRERPFVRIGGNETVGMGWCRVMEVPA